MSLAMCVYCNINNEPGLGMTAVGVRVRVSASGFDVYQTNDAWCICCPPVTQPTAHVTISYYNAKAPIRGDTPSCAAFVVEPIQLLMLNICTPAGQSGAETQNRRTDRMLRLASPQVHRVSQGQVSVFLKPHVYIPHEQSCISHVYALYSKFKVLIIDSCYPCQPNLRKTPLLRPILSMQTLSMTPLHNLAQASRVPHTIHGMNNWPKENEIWREENKSWMPKQRILEHMGAIIGHSVSSLYLVSYLFQILTKGAVSVQSSPLFITRFQKKYQKRLALWLHGFINYGLCSWAHWLWTW